MRQSEGDAGGEVEHMRDFCGCTTGSPEPNGRGLDERPRSLGPLGTIKNGNKGHDGTSQNGRSLGPGTLYILVKFLIQQLAIKI